LFGRLSSLPLTVLGGFLLGMAQTYPRVFSSLSGTADLVTFVLVLLTLGVLFRPGSRRVRVV
jgi:branched-subunit amino acid ABC-type transport system permease component